MLRDFDTWFMDCVVQGIANRVQNIRAAIIAIAALMFLLSAWTATTPLSTMVALIWLPLCRWRLDIWSTAERTMKARRARNPLRADWGETGSRCMCYFFFCFDFWRSYAALPRLAYVESYNLLLLFFWAMAAVDLPDPPARQSAAGNPWFTTAGARS